jgi:hypothetical protein
MLKIANKRGYRARREWPPERGVAKASSARILLHSNNPQPGKKKDVGDHIHAEPRAATICVVDGV